MKSTAILIVLLCVFLLPIHSNQLEQQEDCSLWTFIDSGIVDALWSPHLSIQAGIGVSIAPGVEIELPCTYILDRQGGHEQLLELLLELKYHPWGTGPFIGVSLAHMCLFVGNSVPKERVHYLNSISFGYTYQLMDKFRIEPLIVFTDPSDSFEDSWSYIHALVPTYSRFRFRLRFGWTFVSFSTSDLPK